MTDNAPFAGFKSGFVAVMGKPNVGKSTLINALVGQKIAAVSPRPQTTRMRQMGILTIENAQVVFEDTPGFHKPRYKLGESMNKHALEALEECDLILFVLDIGQPPDDEDRLLAAEINRIKRPVPILLVLNKADQADPEEIPNQAADLKELVPNASAYLPVSATRGDNLEPLIQEILVRLPEGLPFFSEGQITDLYEKEIAADLIREAALILLRDEVPHGIAVRIDEFTERGDDGAYIEATIFVERESHKGIVIGQGGRMLKQIGSEARREIEAMSGRKVFLRLRVKVRQNWRNDDSVLRWFGY